MKNVLTMIEYRDPKDNKLKELVFDEPQIYVQRRINQLIEEGATDLVVVANPRNFQLTLKQEL